MLPHPNKQKGKYRETTVNFRISGRLYFACSKLDQLFATDRIILTLADRLCNLQNKQ
jgi:hypothetical protein